MKDEAAAGRGAEAKSEGQEVLFACGNWCYRGQIQFNNLKMNLSGAYSDSYTAEAAGVSAVFL